MSRERGGEVKRDGGSNGRGWMEGQREGVRSERGKGREGERKEEVWLIKIFLVLATPDFWRQALQQCSLLTNFTIDNLPQTKLPIASHTKLIRT